MNAQEIFDKVCTHLMTQRVVATNCFGSCGYRGANGSMCAVGCLIPDEIYDVGMECNTVGTLVDEWIGLPYYIYKYKELLRVLQIAHDAYLGNSVEACANKLSGVAEEFKLVLPEIVKKELA